MKNACINVVYCTGEILMLHIKPWDLDGKKYDTGTLMGLSDYKGFYHVQGKVFAFTDMPTRKVVRGLSHSCAIDIDVFTGLSVIVDDRFPTSMKLARSVKLNKLTIRSLRFIPNEQLYPDTMWFFDPETFSNVTELSWEGLINFKWIEECMLMFQNLTTLEISGAALDMPIFPPSRTKSRSLTFSALRSLEISSTEANYNMLHASVRRKIFSDSSSSSPQSSSNEEEDKPPGELPSFKSSTSKLPIDLEAGKVWDPDESAYVDSTPVAENIYYLLLNIHAPNLMYFRLTYNEELYNIGHLNWRDKPLISFLQRHGKTLQTLILDGEQNDIESQPAPLPTMHGIPEKLRYLYLSIVEPPDRRRQKGTFLPFLKSLMGLKMIPNGSFWEELLRKQRSLVAIHCSIHAPWAWGTLSKTIEKNCHFLHTINIGCHWTDPSSLMDMEVVSRCVFLRKLTFNVTTSGEKTTCRVVNLSSVLACVLLESVFITHALCETDELEVFSHMPSLNTLVLMYTGRMADCGVTVGVLQDFLHIRTLNLLIVVEFYKQKHCMNAHVLKRILRSSVNTADCPIISRLVPYASPGTFVYVGNITEALI